MRMPPLKCIARGRNTSNVPSDADMADARSLQRFEGALQSAGLMIHDVIVGQLASPTTSVPIARNPWTHVPGTPSRGPHFSLGEDFRIMGHSRLTMDRAACSNSDKRSRRIAQESPRLNSSSLQPAGQTSPPIRP